MKTKTIYTILFIVFFFFQNVTAQETSPVDSLLYELEKTTIDTSKVTILNDLANNLKGRENEKAMTYAQQALQLAVKTNFKEGEAKVYKTIGIIFFFQGDFDKAFENFYSSRDTYESIGDKKGVAASCVNIGILKRNLGEIKESGDSYQNALDIYREINDNEGIAKTYLNLGNLFKLQGDYKSALDNYLNSLKFYEETGDKSMIAQSYQNIGIVYSEQNDSKKAVENFTKALDIFTEMGDKRGLAGVNNNLGTNYSDNNDFKSAIEYYEKSLQLFEEIGFTPMVAESYYNLGDAHNKINEFGKAKEYFDKSLEINESIGYQRGIAFCYNGLGEYYYNKREYKSAIEYLEKAKEIALQTDINISLEAVEWLSKTFEKTGDYKNAYENHVLFKSLNDSIFNENNEKSIMALSMQYEFDKKEKIREIEEQKKEAIQKEKDKWDFRVKLGLSLLVLSMLIIVVISIRNYRRKVKANKLLRAQKEEIEFQKIELEQRNEEIQAQRDEIEDKNVLITDQRDIALKQKQEITDSIQYAQRIQEAVLPERKMFVNDIDDYFIYFKPKDIVSGDFYWMTKIDDKLIVTAVDCTGHGVPGAFMSLLGVSFLNEIVNKEKTLRANQILNKLRAKVIDSLHQKDRETKDGMDMSLAIIDTKKQEIQYSGAYNPLYIIPKEYEGKREIKKYPADRMPIGIHLKVDKEFSNHTIKYNKGDSVYLFSDGYMDQFGGEKGRKLKTRKFQEIILEIQDKSMSEQKDYLDNFLQEWKGDLDQLDDIIIIGLKL